MALPPSRARRLDQKHARQRLTFDDSLTSQRPEAHVLELSDGLFGGRALPHGRCATGRALHVSPSPHELQAERVDHRNLKSERVDLNYLPHIFSRWVRTRGLVFLERHGGSFNAEALVIAIESRPLLRGLEQERPSE